MQRTDPRELRYQPGADGSHGGPAGPARPLQVTYTVTYTPLHTVLSG